MLCPRPSTFLRQNLHIEKRRKQPQTEEALSVLEILTHLHTSFCKVTLWTLQTWSAVVPASPEPFIRLWTLFVSPHTCSPRRWKQRRGVTGTRWVWNAAPHHRTGHDVNTGTVALHLSLLAVVQRQRSYMGISLWTGPSLCSTLHPQVFPHIAEAKSSPTQYIKYKYNLLKHSDSPFDMLS